MRENLNRIFALSVCTHTSVHTCVRTLQPVQKEEKNTTHIEQNKK
jgi:hypothetical protein